MNATGKDTLADLTRSLQDQIAMARFLEVRFLAFEDARIELGAPLAPTLNHRGVAFGPGVYTTAALAPWLLLVRWAWARRLRARVVLRRSEFALQRPVDRDYRVVCEGLPAVDLDEFSAIGKTRLSAGSQVYADEGPPAASYTGHFTIVAAGAEAHEGDLMLPFDPAWRS